MATQSLLHIKSSSNRNIVRVRELIRKSKARKEMKAFVAEGERFVNDIPAEKIIELYVSESYIESGRKIPETDCSIYSLPDSLMKSVSDTDNPQGLLAVVSDPSEPVEEIVDRAFSKKKNPLFLVLCGIQDPGNLGTMCRTAEGAYADGIIMSGDTCDPLSPKAARASMGSMTRVPFCRLAPGELTGCLSFLKERKVSLLAAYLEGSHVYSDVDMRGATAILIGNEGSGLKKETADMADMKIRIPMGGQLESLNAAVSAAVIMYEAYRQRR